MKEKNKNYRELQIVQNLTGGLIMGKPKKKDRKPKTNINPNQRQIKFFFDTHGTFKDGKMIEPHLKSFRRTCQNRKTTPILVTENGVGITTALHSEAEKSINNFINHRKVIEAADNDVVTVRVKGGKMHFMTSPYVKGEMVAVSKHVQDGGRIGIIELGDFDYVKNIERLNGEKNKVVQEMNKKLQKKEIPHQEYQKYIKIQLKINKLRHESIRKNLRKRILDNPNQEFFIRLGVMHSYIVEEIQSIMEELHSELKRKGVNVELKLEKNFRENPLVLDLHFKVQDKLHKGNQLKEEDLERGIIANMIQSTLLHSMSEKLGVSTGNNRIALFLNTTIESLPRQDLTTLIKTMDETAFIEKLTNKLSLKQSESELIGKFFSPSKKLQKSEVRQVIQLMEKIIREHSHQSKRDEVLHTLDEIKKNEGR